MVKTKSKSRVRNIRFPEGVYDRIDALAKANSQTFSAMTLLLINQALQNPQLIVPEENNK